MDADLADVGPPKNRPSRARWSIFLNLLPPLTALTYLAVSSGLTGDVHDHALGPDSCTIADQHQDGIHAYLANQSASNDTTSPPALVAIARHVGRATPSRTKTTWPSQNSTLTPPGWRLRAAFQPGLW